jgi:hypothetical protein
MDSLFVGCYFYPHPDIQSLPDVVDSSGDQPVVSLNTAHNPYVNKFTNESLYTEQPKYLHKFTNDPRYKPEYNVPNYSNYTYIPSVVYGGGYNITLIIAIIAVCVLLIMYNDSLPEIDPNCIQQFFNIDEISINY